MRNVTALIMLSDDQISRLKERGQPAIRSKMASLPGAFFDGYRRYRYWVPILYFVTVADKRWVCCWDQSVYGLSLWPTGRPDSYANSPHWPLARQRPGYNAVLMAADEAHTFGINGEKEDSPEHPGLYVAGGDDINYVLGLPLL